MTRQDIDGYLASVEEPGRTTLEALRRSILRVVPEAEECLSYGLPAFKVHGKTFAGFAAFKNHLSYLPHSGSVLGQLGDEVARYQATKGSMHFAAGEPLPDALVRRLVVAKLQELGFGEGVERAQT
jgi:uncharacterized protein YdhG (YjbR/CyaY superfamily)